MFRCSNLRLLSSKAWDRIYCE